MNANFAGFSPNEFNIPEKIILAKRFTSIKNCIELPPMEKQSVFVILRLYVRVHLRHIEREGEIERKRVRDREQVDQCSK